MSRPRISFQGVLEGPDCFFWRPVRSDQGVSEAVSEPAMAVLSRFEGVQEQFSCLCSGTCIGSVQGVSEAFPGGRESRFRESLRVLPASFGGPARSDQGVSEAVRRF